MYKVYCWVCCSHQSKQRRFIYKYSFNFYELSLGSAQFTIRCINVESDLHKGSFLKEEMICCYFYFSVIPIRGGMKELCRNGLSILILAPIGQRSNMLNRYVYSENTIP